MSEIKQNIQDLASKLESGMTLENGVISTGKDLYENTLPENITMDDVKKVYGHTEDLTAAFTLATGNLAEAAMKKDKKLDHITSSMKLGNVGEINVGYQRSMQQTIRNPAKPDEPARQETRYGCATPRVTTFAAKNRGELKKVRETLRERAESLFK